MVHRRPTSMRVYVTEQKRGVTKAIKRELRRRAAVEPVIGHMKNEHRMDRNYLLHTQGDAANAVLAAVGYNFARLLAWLRRGGAAVELAPFSNACPWPAGDPDDQTSEKGLVQQTDAVANHCLCDHAPACGHDASPA